MNIKEYREQYNNDDGAPGWDAIDRELGCLYEGQTPRHYAPSAHYSIGGSDPLDGVSVYDAVSGVSHYHLASYGMSELYFNEEAFQGEYSGYGCEFSFRVQVDSSDDGDPHWAINLMQNLARYVYDSGNIFKPYHVIPANGPIKSSSDTELVAVMFVPDPQLGTIKTVHGKVEFLQLFGITEKELTETNGSLEGVKGLAQTHIMANPMLVTDLSRGGI